MGDIGVGPIPDGASNSDNPANTLQCTICLSAFSQESRVNGCNHSFCLFCISEWVCQSLRPSCPMCRHDVDKVLYDFTDHEDGKKEIEIKEFRSGHMSLTPSDRSQLFSERRLVVRNLMHSYKTLGLLESEIAEIGESKEPDEVTKATLRELADVVTQHIQKAELSLANLRTEFTRRNKSSVFNTLTFRRMIYSNKIKVKHSDTKKGKTQPFDISKEPERFRSFIVDFLITEFDAIPFQTQPKPGGHKWRTKFLGGNIDMNQKQRYAAQIYELMLSSQVGTENFQKELNEILSPVSDTHIKFLDDHLAAIIATEKTNIEDFYNEVYYDSIYNSFSQNIFDYNAMMHIRDDPQSRFEAIFSQIHREMNPEWFGNSNARLHRQSSNTNATDRATNNDDDSDRSSSPDELMPSMRSNEPREHSFARVYIEHMLGGAPRERTRIERGVLSRGRRQPEESDETTRTLSLNSQLTSMGTQMTLRSRARREREISSSLTGVGAPAESRPRTRRETEQEQIQERIRELDSRSYGFTRVLRATVTGPSYSGRFSDFRLPSGVTMTVRTSDGVVNVPMYHARTRRNDLSEDSNSVRNSVWERRLSEAEPASTNETAPRRSSRLSRASDPVEHSGAELYLSYEQFQRARAARNGEAPRSLERVVVAADREADNGLDFISVAQRTRAARRAARGEQASEAPPAKRSTNSRRDRH